MRILNFGSLNLDYVYQVDHFVQPGETLSALSQRVNAGGKGLNQSIALARALGRDPEIDAKIAAQSAAGIAAEAIEGPEISVFHAGCLGAGGESLKALLEENGANTRFLKPVSELQGNAVIQVEQGGENCILLFGGSNQCVTKEQIAETLEGFCPGDVLVLQNEINLLPEIVDAAFEKGMQIFLNPSPYNDKIAAVDLGKISWLLVNAVEAQQICEAQNESGRACKGADDGPAAADSAGKTDPAAVWEILHSRYPGLSLLVTLGKRGSIAFTGTESIAQGAFPVEAVDSTGAGDTYTGYFIAALSRGFSLLKAMQQASMASAISVTRPGAAPSIPEYAEVAEALGKLAK